MKEQEIVFNNGIYIGFIIICLGLIAVVGWTYVEPGFKKWLSKFKKSDKPQVGKVKKMEIDRLLDLDDHEMHIR